MRLWLTILWCCLSGCAIVAPQDDGLAPFATWRSLRFSGEHFEVVGWQKSGPANAGVVPIYIEGDGFAWASPSQPSTDPTPRKPVAMQLALQDPAEQVIYLARPCQYAARQALGCANNRWWTSARYSREVINHYHLILSQLHQQYTDARYAFVAYSGGAAIAAILASERQDVDSLRTVAGNLDSEYVNAIHHATPMPQSLNPIAHRLNLPQIHFVGGRDRVVPRAVSSRFVAAQDRPCAAIKELSEVDHATGWVEAWQQLLRIKLPDCEH